MSAPAQGICCGNCVYYEEVEDTHGECRRYAPHPNSPSYVPKVEAVGQIKYDMIGIIGGTGLGDALTAAMKDPEFEQPDTPFGEPSGPILVGTLGKTEIAFLSRHGGGQIARPPRRRAERGGAQPRTQPRLSPNHSQPARPKVRRATAPATIR